MKKVAIVGGGASGLLCAIVCAQKNCDVTIFEQNTKVAKKILVSGNGRCNISNTNLSEQNYFSEDSGFVRYALEQFGFHAFEKFCKEIGLLLYTLEDGRTYPKSDEAKSVALLFEQKALSLGVKIKTEHPIKTITPLFDSFDAVVVASGSRAAEHLGGNDAAECFAKEVGHTIITPYPSLVQLHLNSKVPSKMAGAKTQATITLKINGIKEQTHKGDILFSTYGISGFGILDISQAASKALSEFMAVDIVLDLLEEFSTQQLAQHFQNTAQKNPSLNLFALTQSLIPQKIANGVLEIAKLDPKQNAATLGTKGFKHLANTLKNLTFEVSDTHGFRHAEVSGGGISTNEIDSKTMMSKKRKNLYFTGEALDVVGQRGGYNFAWAWASGYVAAHSIIKR